MPLGPGTYYRYRKGTHVRLAFSPGGKVIEAKNMKTGAEHTKAEFEHDAQAKALHKMGGKA